MAKTVNAYQVQRDHILTALPAAVDMAVEKGAVSQLIAAINYYDAQIAKAEALEAKGTTRPNYRMLHGAQQDIRISRLQNPKLHHVVVAGRRSGKTDFAADDACYMFIEEQKRVLYVAPTSRQTDAYWSAVKQILDPLIETGEVLVNGSRNYVYFNGRENDGPRVTAKTGSKPDNLRGDWAHVAQMDEYQMQNEHLWESVILPMLIDEGGHAMFFMTPPNPYSTSESYARDIMHARDFWQRAAADPTFIRHKFTAHNNPYIDQEFLASLKDSMHQDRYRIEIMAEFVNRSDMVALWTPNMIVKSSTVPDLDDTVVGVDPTGTIEGDACGIVAAGVAGSGTDARYFIVEDATVSGRSPEAWAEAAIDLAIDAEASAIIVEKNFGGEMATAVLEAALRERDAAIPVLEVTASRGKIQRAEPIAQLYSMGKVTHVPGLQALEQEMVTWTPNSRKSPDRMDAMVWAMTHLSEAPDMEMIVLGLG